LVDALGHDRDDDQPRHHRLQEVHETDAGAVADGDVEEGDARLLRGGDRERLRAAVGVEELDRGVGRVAEESASARAIVVWTSLRSEATRTRVIDRSIDPITC
jgi:hypothetical protein